MSPIILVGAGILLFGFGLGLGYWFAHSQGKREATRASDIQNELDCYRRNVTEHFGETAQHFQTLGQQYQSLYKHMVQGAEALCDPTESDDLLGFAAGSAAAITASTTEKPEKPPEVIRDYATEEEIQSSKVKSEAESSPTSESPEISSAPDDGTAESDAEAVVADRVDTPAPVGKERTVH